MDDINKLSFELHEMLMNSNEYLTLKEKENIMLSDNVSKSLIDKYHSLQERYSFENTQEVLKLLHDAKLKMDQDINVINYRKAYKQYQLLIGTVTDIVFEDYTSNTLLDKIIRAK